MSNILNWEWSNGDFEGDSLFLIVYVINNIHTIIKVKFYPGAFPDNE